MQKMQTQVHRFGGMMDYDTPNQVWVKGRHKTARNILFRGEKGDLVPENIPGTRELTFSLPAGTNVCIGRFYDEPKKRTFYFNYNSNLTHAIYIVKDDETFQTLIINGGSTDGNILGFMAIVTIDSIDIFYGDPLNGDILLFVDSLKRPTKINIDRYLANTYSLIKRSFIDVAKAPPQMPIKAVYENDTTVGINNVRKILCQFIHRRVYDDGEKSVWSSASIVPLPFQPTTQPTQDDFTLNCRISLFMNTGEADVKGIEIAFRFVTNGILSKYYLITKLDKVALGIADNDVYNYRFYNGDSYNPIDIKEQVLLQSYVPQTAACQALLDGSVIAYANIKEGYDQVAASLAVNPQAFAAASYFFDYQGLLFFGTVSGTDSGTSGTIVKLYLYGTGTNTAGSVTTLNNGYARYVVNILNNAGTSVGFDYINASDTPTVASVLAGVSAGLVTNGFTQVSLVGNILTMSYPTAVTILSSGTKTGNNANPLNSTTTRFSYAWQSAHTFGVMYFDDKGRTNGAILSAGGSFMLPVNNGGNMSPQLSISHRPPSWAVYYQVIRSPDLTYNKIFTWLSNGAYADSDVNIVGKRYAYFEIDNVQQYNDQIESTDGVVGYTFSPGDRIRIYGRYTSAGVPAAIGSTFDYEVQGTESTIIIDGLPRVGNFIKVLYPTADISANYKFDGAQDFLNYNILVYNYVKHAAETNNEVFFECGKCFGIGNPGTNLAYHMGLEQTQSTNLATPALITLANGDLFQRIRRAPGGQSFNIYNTGKGNGFRYFSPVSTTAAITNTRYKVHNNAGAQFNALVGDYTAGNNSFENLSAAPITIRIRATIPLSCGVDIFSAVYVQCTDSTTAYKMFTAVKPFSSVSGVGYNVDVDIYVIVPPLNNARLLIENQTMGINQDIGDFNMRIDVINDISFDITENSFSDIYNMVINSNGRPSVFEPNAKQVTDTTLFRFSQPYQAGTIINGMSLFYPNNYDNFTKDYGAVMRMINHERTLRIYQETRIGQVGVYSKFIKDKDGNSNLITSDAIITPNNIDYYTGRFGLGNQPSGIVTVGNVDYFVCPTRGYICRLSQDGITPLTDLYNMQTWAGAVIPQYNTNTAYQFGGYAKVLGTFNYIKDRHGEVIFMFQGGGGKTAYTISFDEDSNSFTSFYDYSADNIICSGNKLITWYNGRTFVHDDIGSNRSFYGVRYKPSIDLVFNENDNIKKEFTSFGVTSPIPSWLPPMVPIWEAPAMGDLLTSLNQRSNLVYGDFETRENYYYSGLWREGVYSNIYNIYEVVTGNYMKGIWMQMHLQCGTYGPMWMFAPFINYLVVPKII